MIIDGNGVEHELLGEREYADFLCTFLHDDRAKVEMRELVDRIQHLLDVGFDGDDEDNYLSLEIALQSLEAVFEYESGVFKGTDYWAEAYWDYNKSRYENFGVGK